MTEIEPYFPTEREYIDFVMENSNEQNLLDSPICEILEIYNIDSKNDFKLEYIKEEYLNEYLMNLFISKLNEIDFSSLKYKAFNVLDMFSQSFLYFEELGTNANSIVMNSFTLSEIKKLFDPILQVQVKRNNMIGHILGVKVFLFNKIKNNDIYLFGEKKVSGFIFKTKKIHNKYYINLNIDKNYILRLHPLLNYSI